MFDKPIIHLQSLQWAFSFELERTIHSTNLLSESQDFWKYVLFDIFFLTHLNKITELKNQVKFNFSSLRFTEFSQILNIISWKYFKSTKLTIIIAYALYKTKVSKFMLHLSFPTRKKSSKIQPFRKIKQQN